MASAFGWGLLAGSSLLIGAAVALRFRIGLRAIGLIMGFGAGVLISAVSFDLVEEAAAKSSGSGWAIGGLFAGCAASSAEISSSTASEAASARTRPAPRRTDRRSRSCSGPCSTAFPSRR